MITVQFKTEDVIYVLPDSESLTQEELEAGPSALDRNRWWPAKIVECCFITQNEEKIGFLKVRVSLSDVHHSMWSPGLHTDPSSTQQWFYTCEEALQRVPQIAKNASLAKRLREYECRPYEYILTDHEDWIPLSSFGAFADKVHHFVALHGLRVSDEDRLIEDPSQRPKPSRPNKIWADGWEKRAYEARAEQQAEEARLNACARAESESSTCHDNNGSINSLSYHCRRPCRNVFPEKCRMPSSCNSSGFSIEAQDCSFHLRGDHQEIEEFSQSPPKLRETVFPNLSLSPLF